MPLSLSRSTPYSVVYLLQNSKKSGCFEPRPTGCHFTVQHSLPLLAILGRWIWVRVRRLELVASGLWDLIGYLTHPQYKRFDPVSSWHYPNFSLSLAKLALAPVTYLTSVSGWRGQEVISFDEHRRQWRVRRSPLILSYTLANCYNRQPSGTLYGSRTRVAGMKIQCLRPLD